MPHSPSFAWTTARPAGRVPAPPAVAPISLRRSSAVLSSLVVSSSPISSDSGRLWSVDTEGAPAGVTPRPGPPATVTPRAAEELGQHARAVDGRVGRAAQRLERLRGVVHQQRAERPRLSRRRVAGRPRRDEALGVVAAVVTDHRPGDAGDPGGDDLVGQRLQRRDVRLRMRHLRGGRGHVRVRAEHRVTAADEVEVPGDRAAGRRLIGLGLRREAVVRSEDLEGDGRGDELHVRGRDHAGRARRRRTRARRPRRRRGSCRASPAHRSGPATPRAPRWPSSWRWWSGRGATRRAA